MVLIMVLVQAGKKSLSEDLTGMLFLIETIVQEEKVAVMTMIFITTPIQIGENRRVWNRIKNTTLNKNGRSGEVDKKITIR